MRTFSILKTSLHAKVLIHPMGKQSKYPEKVYQLLICSESNKENNPDKPDVSLFVALDCEMD